MRKIIRLIPLLLIPVFFISCASTAQRLDAYKKPNHVPGIKQKGVKEGTKLGDGTLILPGTRVDFTGTLYRPKKRK